MTRPWWRLGRALFGVMLGASVAGCIDTVFRAPVDSKIRTQVLSELPTEYVYGYSPDDGGTEFIQEIDRYHGRIDRLDTQDVWNTIAPNTDELLLAEFLERIRMTSLPDGQIDYVIVLTPEITEEVAKGWWGQKQSLSAIVIPLAETSPPQEIRSSVHIGMTMVLPPIFMVESWPKEKSGERWVALGRSVGAMLAATHSDMSSRIVVVWTVKASQLKWMMVEDAKTAINEERWEAAYRLLEDGFTSKDYQLRFHARELVAENPKIMDGGKRSFSEDSFRETIRDFGSEAATIEWTRLLSYKSVASDESWNEAWQNFQKIFPAFQPPN